MTIEEMYQQDPLIAVDDSKIPPSVLYMLKNAYWVLKGQCNEILESCFFHQKAAPGPIRVTLGQF